MADWLDDHIQGALKEGKRPQVEVNPGAEVVMPKRPTGRPRVYPEGVPRYFRYLGLHGRARPRCLARGCKNMLKRDQKAACSPQCADAIFNRCIWLLRLIEATPEEILKHFPEETDHGNRSSDPDQESS
jgi:hypothetical protein